MTIRKVARMGHPILRQKAQMVPVESITSPSFQQLISDMIETMHEYGGIGLAAPQVHESVQLAVICLPTGETSSKRKGKKKKDKHDKHKEEEEPITIFINPVTKVLDPSLQGCWEGCLSVPGMRGFVERPCQIQVDYYNEKGEKMTLIAEDFIATVVQHELDHLEGVLYVERMKDMKKFTFNEENDKYPHEDDEMEMSE